MKPRALVSLAVAGLALQTGSGAPRRDWAMTRISGE
jgi:hypothetical protein